MKILNCKLVHDVSNGLLEYHSTCKLHYHEDLGGYISCGIVASNFLGEVLESVDDK